jgi:RNA polymerase sigma-70 factor, ECF subfamily
MKPDLQALEDDALLRRFTQGDADAFGVLLTRYERPIYNFILRFTRDPAAAQDLLQEVFLRVVHRSGDFQGNSKVSTWIYTIARNLCIDATRRNAHRRHPSLDAPSGRADGAPLVERTAGHEPGPERLAETGHMRARIAEAVEALPDEQREVFLMRSVQHLAFAEIAHITQVSENTVKSRMRYALLRLQQALAEYEDYLSDVT